MNKYIEQEVAIKALMNDAPEQVGYSREDAADCIRHMDAADIECCGRLRGVTYEDGKVTAVYIRDTDDAVKVFIKVRHGRWLSDGRCSECLANPLTTHKAYCPVCGAKMDGDED